MTHPAVVKQQQVEIVVSKNKTNEVHRVNVTFHINQKHILLF